jgi:hypothetical protein
MRTALVVLAVVAQSQLLGTWVSVQRSLGGLGSTLAFLPDGKLERSFGPIVEGWYEIAGDKLIEPPSTVNGAPRISRFRVEGDTLFIRSEKGSAEARFTRIGKKPESASIVGIWRPVEKPQGDPRLAAALGREIREYTRDGLTKFRLPLQTQTGTYDVSSASIKLDRPARFRLDKGLLIVMTAEGEESFVRADATKEELRAAGIRYGDRPAELDRPAH